MNINYQNQLIPEKTTTKELSSLYKVKEDAHEFLKNVRQCIYWTAFTTDLTYVNIKLPKKFTADLRSAVVNSLQDTGFVVRFKYHTFLDYVVMSIQWNS